MGKTEIFSAHINAGYTCKGDSLILGSAILDGETIPGAYVKVPLNNA